MKKNKRSRITYFFFIKQQKSYQIIAKTFDFDNLAYFLNIATGGLDL